MIPTIDTLQQESRGQAERDLPAKAARLIAFYLPQFHPTPENDRWWGCGFTEWTNVAKAKPLFRGHYQPHVPADLGFYDLRLPETRAAQAALAAGAGVEGFCYWHYWFAGRRLLERPFEEVLRLGEPRLPFCLGWANQTWTGIWHGAPNKVLIEQTYPGRADHERHFHAVLEAFHDPRYIRVAGKPVFLIYRPSELPNVDDYIAQWQALAGRHGLPGIHFIAHVWFNDPADYIAKGFDAVVFQELFRASSQNSWRRSSRALARADNDQTAINRLTLRPRMVRDALLLKMRKHLHSCRSLPNVINYAEAMLYFLDSAAASPDAYPCVVPNWDNSPRSGSRALVLHDSSPELFRQHLRSALALVRPRPPEKRLVFVKSWNEWAEGNYLEPDLRFGHGYLDVLRDEVMSASPQAMTSPDLVAACN
jgi:hypothetical protein